MRDPWSDESAMPDELRGAVWLRETRARERACVWAANLVVVTSQAHEELQVAKYPDVRSDRHGSQRCGSRSVADGVAGNRS